MPTPAALPTSDLSPSPRPTFGHLPWGYGENRITLMARDPWWLFAYWEIADAAIQAARKRLGSPDAWPALRVYDTTYREFDGTNAHWHMDIGVDRTTRNYYIHVGRPGSVFHADIGMASAGGGFATIARSGAAETPRDSISPNDRVEWMTVTPEGAPAPSYAHRRGAAVPLSPAVAASGVLGEAWGRALSEERWVRWVLWTEPEGREIWSLQAEGGEPLIEIVLDRRSGDGVGRPVPWSVTIWGRDASGQRKILDRWTVAYPEQAVSALPADAIVKRVLEQLRTGLAPAGSAARLSAFWSGAGLGRP